jgi:hypothetical protein
MMQIEFKLHPGQTAIVLTGAFNKKTVRVISCEFRNSKQYLCEVIGMGVITPFDEDQLKRVDFSDTTPDGPEAEAPGLLATNTTLTMVDDGGPDTEADEDDFGPDADVDEDDPGAEDAAIEEDD